MSRIRRALSLLLALTLAIGLVPANGVDTQQASASSYKLVTLKGTTNGSNVTLNSNNNKLMVGNGTPAVFVMTDWGDGSVSFRAQSNGMLVSASGTSDLTASATAVRITETFNKTDAGNGTVALMSLASGKYWSATGNNTIQASSDSYNTVSQKLIITDVTPQSGPNPEIRVLEITDDGTSELLPLLGANANPIVKIDSVRMKQFVAQRDELDGRYDAIYIGKGAYNATLVSTSGQNHDTKSIMNDITNLKMNEIKDYYIDRGLPVVVYSQATGANAGIGALYQNKAGILKDALDDYAVSLTSSAYPFVPASRKSNVIFVGPSDMTTNAFLTKTNLISRAAERPRLVLTGKPIDYTDNQDKIYVAGDTLTYTFNVANIPNISQRSLVANLYIGIDSVLKFDSNNLIASQSVTAVNGNTLTFRLPKGYSGVHYWKLEIVDQGTHMKDIQSGVLRFRDELTKINVLQVLPSSGDASSLLKESNMKQSYLTTPDYAITIKTMPISTFNDTGYLSLNGHYDMLIFGFVDSYNSNAPISQTAANAVNAFIATGQSVMFTHDTVFQGSSNWISYFQTSTGQLSPMTNMGLNAPQTSTTTKKVNEGLLTRFPFNISSVITKVNTTHDQYFGLKLEDPKLIPWYNITGGTRDDDDSWNHYYTYSYGNVTYSGTGHTNTSFPDWEQRLFVNTMYRAFIGSNHAPTLTVDSPTNTAATGKIIPSYNKVLLSYTPQDYDVIDRRLSTSVTFKYRRLPADAWTEREVKAYTEKETGVIITESYDNPLPEGGDLIVTISAKDKSGATVRQEITTKVVKVTANVDLNRTLSAHVVNNQIEKNVPYTMTYKITPKSIPYQNGIDPADLVIKNFKLDEKLPANLELLPGDVSSLVQQPTITGTLAAGYRLKGGLPDIPYRRSGNQFVADPVSFEVKVTPRANGNYIVQDSNLTFTDFYVNGSTVTKDIERALQFQPYAIQAVTKMTSLSLKDATIAKGDTSILTPVIGPEDTTNKTLEWTSDRPDLVTVNGQGIIEGKAEGVARVMAKATDGSGLVAVANVTVVVPGINIVGPATVNVDDTINLEAKLVLANEELTSLNWTIASSRNDAADLGNGTNELKKTLTGVNRGSVEIKVVAVTSKSKTYEKVVTVTVLQPIELKLPETIHIGVGEEYKQNLWSQYLTVSPAEKRNDLQAYTVWTSDNPEILQFSEGGSIAIGQRTGTTTIRAKYRKNPKSDYVEAAARVTVVSLPGQDHITVEKGKTGVDLRALIHPEPAALGSEILGKLAWRDDTASNYASVGSTGTLSAPNAGIENVTATYRYQPGDPVAAVKTIMVKVVDLGAPASFTIGAGMTFNPADLLSIQPSALIAEIQSGLAWTDDPASDTLTYNSQTKEYTANRGGTETLTVTYRPTDGQPITRTIEVRVEQISLSGATVTLAPGDTFDLYGKLAIQPDAAKPLIEPALVWSETDGNGTVSLTGDGGVIRADAPGIEAVTVRYRNALNQEFTATMTVQVVKLAFTASPKMGVDSTKDMLALLDIQPAELRQSVIDRLIWKDESGNPSLDLSASGLATGRNPNPGPEKVTVSVPADGTLPIEAVTIVTVLKVYLGEDMNLTLPKYNAEVPDKGIQDLATYLNDQPAWVKEGLQWSIADNGSTLTPAGQVTATKPGVAHVQVSYSDPDTGVKSEPRIFTVDIIDLNIVRTITLDTDTNGYSIFSGDKGQLSILPAILIPKVKSGLSWTDAPGDAVTLSGSIGKTAGDGTLSTGSAAGSEKLTITYTPTDGSEPISTQVEIRVVNPTPPASSFDDRY
ncbi:DUF5057 domain-containing protein [Cohnella sp. JJ-181]|uniref:DUF5057 domain-containing protein n=1 Tax=Cohnella rhizoplanae TaxID=2974897 RepID=UPI0022FF94BC|nr:DUF5057 domain-containing protein [Cohnella sp. JJ-181]CAI6040925.1 hypothetical protein COHCIP112018_01084 [Cohnella sp. JJ-181]